MQENIFEFDQIIRFSDCDPAGICYFGRYSTFFDESFIAAMRENNIGWDDHKRLNFLLPIVETSTRYFFPLKAGDTAKIFMTVKRIGNRSFTSQHKIFKSDNGVDILVAKGFISRVTVDYNSFKPIIIPKKMQEILDKYVIEDKKWDSFMESK